MKAYLILTILTSLLAALFCYTATVKLIDPPAFRTVLELQPFSTPVSKVLLWTVPLAEAATALLLLFTYTRRTGLWLSAGLLLLFTVYAGLVVSGYYPHRPCACGGIISGLTWNQHFGFNLLFTAVSVTALYLHRYTGRKAFHTNLLQSGEAEHLQNIVGEHSIK